MYGVMYTGFLSFLYSLFSRIIIIFFFAEEKKAFYAMGQTPLPPAPVQLSRHTLTLFLPTQPSLSELNTLWFVSKTFKKLLKK